MKKFIKDLTSVGISKFLIILFSLGRGIIIARWLGPEKNGIIAALAVYPSLFMTIGSLGIRQSTAYFTGQNKFPEDKIKTAISQIWIFTTILSVISCFLLIRFFSSSGDNLIWVILAVIPIPFKLFNTYNSGIFLGNNDIRYFNKINWIPPLIILIVIILFVVIIPLGVSGALIASASGAVFMFLVLLFKHNFIKFINLKVEWKVIKEMLSLGVIYAIALLVINLNWKVDIIILDKLSTSFETGIYSKGVHITEYLWHIPMMLSTIIFARSSNAKDGYKFSLKVSQLLRISYIIIGFASILLIVLSKPIILLLYGREFLQSYLVLQWLLPGVLLITVFKVLNMDLAGKGKPWVSMKAMVPALIINIVLNIVLIPTYGAVGAALTSTVSYSFAAIMFIIFYSKEVKIPIKQIFKYSKNDFSPFIKLFKKRHI